MASVRSNSRVVILSTVGAEVGEDLGSERPGDGEAEVEHEDAGQRRVRRRRRVAADAGRGGHVGGDVGDVGRRRRRGAGSAG